MSIFRAGLLKDKTAFVTGGGSGIGLRMAERFAEHGARVVLAGRKQEKLDAAASAIRAAGGTAEPAALDVRDYAAVEDALRKTHQRFGEIDILVCAAAGNFPALVTGMSANGFKAVIDIDLLGTFRPVARLRRQSRCRAAYEDPRNRVGAGGHSRELHHARADR
jgi:NAD(P)-dependent dehydrogenase (short-subunit alcohol dehydrogenase family)